jgi:hypothetical protein
MWMDERVADARGQGRLASRNGGTVSERRAVHIPERSKRTTKMGER